MASHGPRTGRPSVGEANNALASLLSAIQSASSPVSNQPTPNSVAGDQPSASSPAAPGGGAAAPSPAAVGGAQYHSSPAYYHHATLPATGVASNGAHPSPSSSHAPTPTEPTPSHQAQAQWSGQTPTALSELGTYELLLQLGAHLGVMGPGNQPLARPVAPDATRTRAEGRSKEAADAPSAPSSQPAAGPSAHASTHHAARESVYRPQPTRSGRMPQRPRARMSTADGNRDSPSAPDPSMSTLLFNDFFDFPSSEDEDDDPDFDPNAPSTDFWGDLLARERADGDWTETEEGWTGSGAPGPGSGRAAAQAGENGITGDEFAREIALLTSALNDPLPDWSYSSSSNAGPKRTSPRRARAAPAPYSHHELPDDGHAAMAQERPPQKRRKVTTRRTTLSPVPEDGRRTESSHSARLDVLPPPGEPLASLSPNARRTSAPLPRSQDGSHLAGFSLSDPAEYRAVAPPPPPAGPAAPSSATASPAVQDADPSSSAAAAEAAAAPVKTRKPRRRLYTPEEAAQRRREQAAERMALKRKEDKEKKILEEARVKKIEEENATLRERCRWLEEKCADLEKRLDRAMGPTLPVRRSAAPPEGHAQGSSPGPERRRQRSHEDEPSSAQTRSDAMSGPGLAGEDESDGGEYQVESSEESSSSEDDDDAGEDADQARREIDGMETEGGEMSPNVATSDSPAAPSSARATGDPDPPAPAAGQSQPTSPNDPSAPAAPAPNAAKFDLTSIGGPALSQLLTLVHAAAQAQGIPMQ